MAAKGEGFDVLRRTQWGYASHPNFGGALMVGLGCEVFQIGRMKEEYGLVESDTFQTMTIQETGGTRKTVDAGVARIKDMLPIAATRQARDAAGLASSCWRCNAAARTAIRASPPIRRSAPPSDMLVRHGGTAILSRDAGDLRRRASADPPRRDARGRREARRAHPLVGGLYASATAAR